MSDEKIEITEAQQLDARRRQVEMSARQHQRVTGHRVMITSVPYGWICFCSSFVPKAANR